MSDSFFTDSELANLRKISMEEVGELIEEMKTKHGSGGDSAEWLVAAHKMFHTITGSAGVAGLMEISELAAEGESLTDPEAVPPDKDAMNRIRKIMGQIEHHLSEPNS